MAGKVELLALDEPARLESDKLDSLVRQLGPVAAENVVCHAIEELAVRLSDLAPLHRAGRMDDLFRLSHSLIGIAGQIGLSSLARAAEDVCYCAQTGDDTALAATLCRLERLGDKSLTAVWDLQDQRI